MNAFGCCIYLELLGLWWKCVKILSHAQLVSLCSILLSIPPRPRWHIILFTPYRVPGDAYFDFEELFRFVSIQSFISPYSAALNAFPTRASSFLKSTPLLRSLLQRYHNFILEFLQHVHERVSVCVWAIFWGNEYSFLMLCVTTFYAWFVLIRLSTWQKITTENISLLMHVVVKDTVISNRRLHPCLHSYCTHNTAQAAGQVDRTML